MENGISIIICCYNSAWIIKECLNALINQDVTESLKWEIIVVNNASTDNTSDIAYNILKESDIDYRIIDEPLAGLLNARIKGINSAKYKYSIFCDDDNLLYPNYVTGMFNIITSNSSLGAIGGMGVAKFEEPPIRLILDNIESYAIGTQVGRKYMLYGAGLCVKTDLVKIIYKEQKLYLTGRCGNQLLAGDDVELVMSIVLRGFNIFATNELKFHHILPKKRLKIKYLYQMYQGFSTATPIVNIYLEVIKNKKLNIKKLRFISWIKFFKTIINFKKPHWFFNVKQSYSNITAYNQWDPKTLQYIYCSLSKIKKNNIK